MMNAHEYQMLAMRTAKDMGSQAANLNHAALGVAGEAGEFCDAVKKHAVYGKALDAENAAEELGDLLWYAALGCDALGVRMADVMQANIDKLRARYPNKYSDADALARADKV